MIVFKQPTKLALARQQTNENFLIRHTLERQFSYLKVLCYAEKIIEAIPNSNQNKDSGKLRGR